MVNIYLSLMTPFFKPLLKLIPFKYRHPLQKNLKFLKTIDNYFKNTEKTKKFDKSGQYVNRGEHLLVLVLQALVEAEPFQTSSSLAAELEKC